MPASMSILGRLFGSRATPDAESTSRLSMPSSFSEKSARRDLLRLVLRDTLQLHGIPTDWIATELLTTTLANGGESMHWRLQVKHWDPRLLTYSVALQDALMEHLHRLDPMVSEWLTGISWQLSLDDDSQCPPLPAASTWLAAPQPAPRPQARTPDHDVETARADLNRWLARRDTDVPRTLESLPPTWAPTQPAQP
jgi:hypothetical protein